MRFNLMSIILFCAVLLKGMNLHMHCANFLIDVKYRLMVTAHNMLPTIGIRSIPVPNISMLANNLIPQPLFMFQMIVILLYCEDANKRN